MLESAKLLVEEAGVGMLVDVHVLEQVLLMCVCVCVYTHVCVYMCI